MHILISLLLLTGGFLSGSSPAEDSFLLSGTITDSETNDPISFAYVHVEELNRTSVADAAA